MRNQIRAYLRNAIPADDSSFLFTTDASIYGSPDAICSPSCPAAASHAPSVSTSPTSRSCLTH